MVAVVSVRSTATAMDPEIPAEPPESPTEATTANSCSLVIALTVIPCAVVTFAPAPIAASVSLVSTTTTSAMPTPAPLVEPPRPPVPLRIEVWSMASMVRVWLGPAIVAASG
jgi:hypothetical protein